MSLHYYAFAKPYFCKSNACMYSPTQSKTVQLDIFVARCEPNIPSFIGYKQSLKSRGLQHGISLSIADNHAQTVC